MEIRESKESDLKQILNVELRAFGKQKGPEIAGLVDRMLIDPTAAPRLSLLAFHDDQAIGHILFTRATIADLDHSVSVVILAPLAVIPESQSEGVGGRLIEAGLRRLRGSGVDLVFVLGHPGYYPRFGFEPAGALGFEAPYPIPEKDSGAWMVQELRPGFIGKVKGKISCADSLNQPEHWRE